MNLQPPKAKDRDSVLHQWLKMAVALHTEDRLAEAETYYQAILKSQPTHFHALHMLGVLRRQQGRLSEAVKVLRQAVKSNAGVAGVHSDLATTLGQLDRFTDALASYERAIALQPDNASAHTDRGAMLFKLGRLDEAVASLDRAVALNPLNAEAHYNRGTILKDLGRFDEALTSFDAAITIRGTYAEAYNNRGLVLTELQRPKDGLDSFDRALAIRPEFFDALVNRGSCLLELNRPEEAVTSLERAILIDASRANAHFLHGNALAEVKRTHEAIAAYDCAIKLSPDPGKAMFNRARQVLLLGDLAAGWRDEERRFDQPGASKRWKAGPYPVWTGQAIADKHIIVYDEQGMGDVIQFARYLLLLRGLGADVTVLALPQIRRLLRSMGNGVTVIDGEPTGAFDYHCQLLSLPMVFGTTLATIPNAVPYLSAEPAAVAAWSDRLRGRDFKIGIVWQGNPAGKIDIGRSVPLRRFQPLSQIPGVRLISLQKNHGLDQLHDLPQGMRVETLGDDVDVGPDAFVDTAAVMANLDLIVTSDTSIAHLAGALGRPVWLALQHVPDWRWQLDRPDSPWYPTMRLYRQSVRGQWDDVFARMAEDLRLKL